MSDRATVVPGLTAVLLMTACRASTWSFTAPEQPVDECGLPCLEVQTLPGAQVELLATATTVLTVEADEDGLALLCPAAGSLPPGTPLRVRHTLGEQVEQRALELDIRPYGWDLGRDRASGQATITALPEWQRAAAPLLTPMPGTWFSLAITSPALVGDLLLFAGTDETDEDADKNAYRLGVAHLVGDQVTAWSPEPILQPADDQAWDATSQNAPTVLQDEDGYTIWYVGRAGEAEGVLGRAFSTDGFNWDPDPANPIYTAGDSQHVTHPTILATETGLLELWYQDAAGGLAYALSADGGASFEPFCDNPLDLPGKSFEVAWTGERYLMAHTAGVPGTYNVQWAESLDGLRWTTSDESVLQAGDSSWENYEITNGPILLGEDGMQMLYVGHGMGPTLPDNGFGLANAL